MHTHNRNNVCAQECGTIYFRSVCVRYDMRDWFFAIIMYIFSLNKAVITHTQTFGSIVVE